VRLVWGSEWRSESVQSMGLYNSDAAFVTEFTRLFGNLEWRAAPQWVMNAGGLFEHSSVTGDTWSPRLMANWHLASGQTLRVGASQAFRPPSTFEKFANLHFIWPAPAPFGFDITNIKSTGQVQPESVLAKEIGYLGEFPQWKLGLDLRLFHEQINGFIRRKDAASLFDYANDENFAIQGWEYQLKWQPWTGAQLILNQAYTDIGSVKPLTGTVMAAPRLASSIAYFQKFANGLDVTLTHQDNSPAVPHNSNINDLFPMTRTDLRLAWPFRMGNRPAEAALVVQNLGLPYQDFDQRFWFMKRAFVTLRVGL
jgi:iron complex outermembrane receptor protein